MGVAMFPLDDSSLRGLPYRDRNFRSAKTHIGILDAEAGGTMDVAEFAIQIKREKRQSEVAICIPSKGLEAIALRGRDVEWRLCEWWEKWRHNIAVDCGAMYNVNGPVFLVLEKTDTKQAYNCYYAGHETETNLHVSGKVADRAEATIEVGFSCQEIGNFGFRDCPKQLDGKKWSIFLRKQDLKLFRFSFQSVFRLLCQYMGPIFSSAKV